MEYLQEKYVLSHPTLKFVRKQSKISLRSLFRTQVTPAKTPKEATASSDVSKDQVIMYL